jgi:DNA repair protein RecO (recombination protein O)
LKSVDTIESFYTLRNDLSTLSYATYFAEFADKVTPEESPNDDVLLLLLKSLKQLTAQKISNSLIARIYELKIMQFCGYTPYLQNCCECGSEEVKFIGTEGLLCEKCAKFLPAVEVNYNIIYVLAYILSADLNHLFTFGVSDETQALLEKINNMLVACHLSLNLKSYKFIKDNNL